MSNLKQSIQRPISILTLFLVFFVNLGWAFASEITPGKMIELTNISRKEVGLKPLNTNEQLTQAAKAKAVDMFADQYFDHTSPDGVTPWYWIKNAGYVYIYAAENLAIDFITAEGAHSALMNSTGHRENILGVSYKDVGIAVLSGKFQNKDSIIIVEDFGAARNPDPSDAFFETPKPVTTIVESAKIEKPKKAEVSENTEAGKSAKPDKAAKEPESIIVISKTDSGEENIIVKDEPEAEQEITVKTKGPLVVDDAIGKIMPKIYSVKDERVLKKVYVENIYWKAAGNGGEVAHSLSSDRARLKVLLRSLTNGACCNVVN